MDDGMEETLFLGIDTGGTFTDGVLLEPATRRIVRKAKVLTTHHDLRLCIEAILVELISQAPGEIALVSLSTTLATNAIAEGKRRPAALFLLGYDAELVEKFRLHESFATDAFFYVDGRMDLEGREQVPLDEIALLSHASRIRQKVEALAVSAYAGPMNSSQEERAAELLEQLTGMPVVQGNHLSSRIGSIQRATTASLNASLLGDAYEFVAAVREMLANKKIRCPLIVVRGDGSLAAAEFAVHRPVEIIHSGPATSAIGGRYLAGVQDALVVDVGGTTTDLALVEDGRTVQNDGEATVGNYHTNVRTIQARSFGLGGDSLIRFDARGMTTVGPERVIPISFLAHENPAVKRDLVELLTSGKELRRADMLEYWVLRREPKIPLRDPRSAKVIELLRGGPRRMATLLKQVGAVSPVLVDADMLFRREVIDRACLTPTDLMHAGGEFSPWDQDIARLIVNSIETVRGAGFIRQVREWITHKIVAEIIEFLSGCHITEEPVGRVKRRDLGSWMFRQNLRPDNRYLKSQIHLAVPIIGIGAPAGYFLPAAAQALGTNLILPEHYEVANAVGTVVAEVSVRHEAEVTPVIKGTATAGFAARAAGKRQEFASREKALEFARQVIFNKAMEEAGWAGAHNPVVDVREEEQAAGIVRLWATAAGKP
jgi:N-methylhydantoinase A/oxoprolinase/acetone carboxylase beta subunit